MNIVEKITQTPDRVATTVTFEDDVKWIRPCEGGCGKPMAENKITYMVKGKPNTPGFDPLNVIEVTKTAPSAGRCITCGPLPKN